MAYQGLNLFVIFPEIESISPLREACVSFPCSMISLQSDKI